MTPPSSVSNIAWPAELRERIYALLRREGVAGIEMAPTKIAPWEALDTDTIAAEKRLIASYGLVVSSYQAIFFGMPDLQLLGDKASFEKMRAHTLRVARIAEQLSGGGVGVFGAPRNRRRGPLDERDAFDLGAERFGLLAETIAPHGFVLGLEPAPTEYGGDYLQTTADCARMVRTVSHPSLRLHIDTGCLELAGDEISKVVGANTDLIAHVHLSKPNLVPISDAEERFSELFRVLASSDYQSWIAIEMRETDRPEQAVHEALAVLTQCRA